MAQADLIRLGWFVMFALSSVGAVLLAGMFIKDRIALGNRDGVLRTQADSTVSDGVVILLGAFSGLIAALASWLSWQLVALAALMALGFFYAVMILNMLRGRRAVTRSLRLTIDKLEEQRRKGRMQA